LKSITQPNSKSTSTLTPTIDGSPMATNNFCENINKYYANVGGEPVPLSDDHCNTPPSSPLQHTSLGEVKILLSGLDTSKATSLEDYPAWVSKEGMEDVCVPLQDIINTMLSTLEFPNKWKRAQITPIPKVTKPSQYKDFRPISLLFHLGKLSEDIIISKMKSTLSEIVDVNQFAYQPKLGTIDALTQLLDDFTDELDQPNTKFMQLAAIDFSKAFDRLQPAILHRKMQLLRFNNNITRLVGNFLSSRKQSVKFTNILSPYIDCKVGAPQGTKLGPILWLIYCNDLAADGFAHIKYADDTTFYTNVKDTRNHAAIAPAIEAAQRWSVNNNMLLNASKTCIMNATLTQRQVYDSDICIDNANLVPCNGVNFLGIFLDNNLSFNIHVQNIVKKCNARLFLMRKLKVVGLSAEGLKLFYNTNVRSLVTYAAPAWFSLLSKQNKTKIESLQIRATRIILPEFSYEERILALNLPYLCDFLFDLSAAHFKKILSNPTHPHFSRISFNSNRKSLRNKSNFYIKKCRTTKRQNSFFTYFMKFFNSADI